MPRQGRLAAIALFSVLVLSLAAGCTENSSGQQFHSYQPGKGSEESQQNTKVADKSDAPKTGAPNVTVAMASAKAVDQKSAERTPVASSARPSSPAASPTVSPNVAAKGAAPSTPRKVQVLVPNKTFRPEGQGGALRVSYDDIDLLKVLNMDPVPPDAATQMPAWLKGLDGRRIRIRGFMYPTFQQTGVHAFGLARDNQICCFGRNPKIYDVFDVVLHEGATTDYIPNRPFDVVGVFHIRPEAEGGKLFRLYEMDDATVVTK
jgi:hypothetical protein